MLFLYCSTEVHNKRNVTVLKLRRWEGPVVHTNTVESGGASRRAAHDAGAIEPRDSVP